MRVKGIITALLVSILLLRANALTAEVEQVKRLPQLSDESAIKLDGIPDEEVWNSAIKFTDFRLKLTGEPSTLKTVMYLIVGSRGLYWAGVCYQKQITATQVSDNEPMYPDDRVILMIDPYASGQGRLTFRVNPLGRHHSTSTWHKNWRPEWYSNAKIFKDFWTFEAFIPYEVLSLHRGENIIGLNLARYIAYAGMLVSLTWGVNYNDPINFPKYELTVGYQVTKLKIMPQIFAYSESHRETVSGLGLDIAYSTSKYTAHFTVNPSFLENVVRERYIKPTVGEYVLSETRPFFREGINYLAPFKVSTRIDDFDLDTYYNLFYTRRLDDIDSAVKLYGRFGEVEGGLLVYRRSDREQGLAFRALYGTGSWRYSCFWIYDTLGIEANFVSTTHKALIQYATKDKEYTYTFEYLYDNGHGLLLNLTTVHVSSNFDPELAYVPLRGINSASFLLANYRYWQHNEIQYGYKLALAYKHIESDIENYFLLPFERDEILGSVQYQIGNLELSVIGVFPKHRELSGEELKSDKLMAKVSYSLSTNKYINLETVNGWFLGQRYKGTELKAEYPISRKVVLGISGNWVRLDDTELRDVTYSLDYRQRNSIFSVGLSYDECDNVNLTLKYQHYLPNGSEIHVLYGDPSARITKHSIYVKYLHKIELSL